MAKIITLIASFCLLVLWAAPASAQAGGGDVDARIQYVLAEVAKSDMTFIRNGDPHTGKEAAKHMRAKYDHFKKKIKTVDDFIAHAGTKSLISGEVYMVKTKDGKEMRSDEWLRSLAASYKAP
jgi:hypothetical protein